MFELVSAEDQAKMEAAKMQADLAQSQQQKCTSSSTDNVSAADKACVDSQAGNVAAPLASHTNTAGSQPVSVASNTAATVTAVSKQPSLSGVGFTPFAKNPAKQKRYEAYLEAVKAGTSCKSAAGYVAVFLKRLIIYMSLAN